MSDLVKIINVDEDVGTLARRLLREHPKLGKPQDAVHVASALLAGVDELHTFDENHLLKFDGVLTKIGTENKDETGKLKIRKPPSKP